MLSVVVVDLCCLQKKMTRDMNKGYTDSCVDLKSRIGALLRREFVKLSESHNSLEAIQLQIFDANKKRKPPPATTQLTQSAEDTSRPLIKHNTMARAKPTSNKRRDPLLGRPRERSTEGRLGDNRTKPAAPKRKRRYRVGECRSVGEIRSCRQ